MTANQTKQHCLLQPSYAAHAIMRFNLRAFWADHKETLPLHYSVYVAEVGCKKGAAANVESVFSGAVEEENPDAANLLH